MHYFFINYINEEDISCQNSFNKILSGLKKVDECKDYLHKPGYRVPTYPPSYNRFIESGDIDGDIDNPQSSSNNFLC